LALNSPSLPLSVAGSLGSKSPKSQSGRNVSGAHCSLRERGDSGNAERKPDPERLRHSWKVAKPDPNPPTLGQYLP
jgi:hypothetical protein